jgi:anaerobic magnesium-protoporphyrin IX monomethyl ester cyclase
VVLDSPGRQMKILLLETTSEHYRSHSHDHVSRTLEPLAVESIGAFLMRGGHEVMVLHQFVIGRSGILSAVAEHQPRLIGVSCLTYNFDETRRTCEEIKRIDPDAAIVLGGYHALGLEDCPPCFDFVVCGEGETAMSDIAEHLEGNREQSEVRNLAFAHGQKIACPVRYREDLATLPWPLRVDRSPYSSQSLGENLPDTVLACVTVGRGCFYTCEFCCTPMLYPVPQGTPRVLHRDLDDVVQELRHLRDHFSVNTINLRDESFGPESLVRRFAGKMIEADLGLSWRAFVNIGMLRQADTFSLMAESGCHMVFFGLESSDQAVLDKYNKRMRVDVSASQVRAAQDAGIFVRAGYIIGDESDGPDAEDVHVSFLLDVCPDELCISFLTPFPGTDLYTRTKDRIKEHDLAKYDGISPIIANPHLSREQLCLMYSAIHKRFYGSQKWQAHILQRVQLRPAEKRTVMAFLAYAGQKYGVPELAVLAGAVESV